MRTVQRDRFHLSDQRRRAFRCAAIIAAWIVMTASFEAFAQSTTIKVGSSAVNLEANDKMDIGGSIEGRFTSEQEGELRATAVVVELPGKGKIAIVSCDVLFVPRDLVDSALAEIEKTTGIPPSHVMVHATHTHHAPSVVNVHGSVASEEFRQILVKGIIKSVEQAHQQLAASRFFFQLSEENTIGGNSRFLLDDGNVSWLSPAKEAAAANGKPTGPFDPQLPVLDFRDPAGKSVALIYNHSTHTIGTRSGRNVRSASFYGLAAQELEQEIGGRVAFLEGASGSTHNITGVPVDEAIKRLKKVIKDARQTAQEQTVTRLAAIRRPFKFKVRQFDDAEEDRKILGYTSKYALAGSDVIRKIFTQSRETMRKHQGEERETYLQVILIGDVAIVGVPAEYFTLFGVDIKKRSPFKQTYVAELANDWIGYLPDRQAHQLGGYQTWLGLHSYAEVGTGERVADEVVKMLNELSNSVAAVNPNPAKPLPAGHSPAEEQASFQLSDPDLKVELVAAEPDVVSPVAMAWDANGRLFVAEMIGYPQTEGLCRIALLEDRDGDGKFTRSATFADQMNFVNSVMPFRKGILATSSPDLIYLEDTDGDGRADIKRVEWTGFATGSQQLRANALHWAMDNFVYGANGRVGGDVHRPDATSPIISLRTRDFRFDPISNQFESIIGQSQFGQAHDDWGRRFLSWNTIPIRQVVLDDQDLRSYAHGPAAAVVNIADPSDTGRIYPISPPPKQFNAEQSTYYNAMCGLSIYRGHQLGDQYAGNAFICESLTNLITRRVLTPAGPTFVSRRADAESNKEFFASADNWTHPVFTTTGPDGAFYFADFYREFVEHPIYVADLKARAETNWRLGAERGRIWRVTRKSVTGQIPRVPPLQQANSAELALELSHPVSWRRETAQRLLVECQDKSAAPMLRQQLAQAKAALGRAHALWTLRGLGELTNEDLITATRDADAQARRQAVKAGRGRWHEAGPLQARLLELAADTDEMVRFEVALALGEVDPDRSAEPLARIIELNHENWFCLAELCAASGEPWSLINALLSRDAWRKSPVDWQVAFLQDLAEQLATGNGGGLPACIESLNVSAPGTIPPGQLALLGGLARGLESRGLTLERSAAQTDSPWRLLHKRLPDLGQTVMTVAKDSHQPVLLRQMAAELTGHLPIPAERESLLSLLDPKQPQAVQSAAAKAVASRDNSDLYRQLFDNWQTLTTATRRDVLNSLLRTSAALPVLFDAVANDKIPRTEIPAHVSVALLQHRDPAIKQRANQLLSAAAAADRQEVIDKYLASVPSQGEAARGVELFRQHCIACHAMKGVGQRVGPDLAAVGSRRRDLLLIDILDPSRHVTPDFAAFMAMTRQGRVVVGVIAAESSNSITLKRERGEQETILRSELEELRPTGKSIMPDGLEKLLSPQQLADVLEYLRRPDGL